ncbi:uncharacterized protein LOC106064691 [Biomphalaria glabrata]|uniref:Uncharacterized protein LOC106064691 n=1 Tax=Biomphalaria glabrata TaxID=6526 RepID=A0A9W3BH78_BIOGL|nr:uncharacterized protein LOC106064691 [Biomphalaria glabrata]
MLAIVGFLIFVSAVSAYPADQPCNIYELNATDIVHRCLGNETQLLNELLLQWQTPFDVICSNLDSVPYFLACVQEEFISCLPYGEELLAVLPDKERMLYGLTFICENKAELVDNECMKETEREHTQCLVSKMYGLKNVLGEPSKRNIQTALCSMVEIQKSCSKLFHGNCTEDALNLADEAYDRLLRLDHCTASNTIVIEDEKHLVTLLLRSMLLPSRTQGHRSKQFFV